MSEDQKPNLDRDDLDLISDHLDDDVKDDAELWQEMDADDAASQELDDSTPDDESGSRADGDGDAADKDSPDNEAMGDGGSEDAPRADSQPGGNQPQGEADVWARATPEMRAAYDAAQEKIRQLEQADRTHRGRLSAQQRQINEITARMTQPAPKQGADQGQQDDGFTTSDEWKSFQEEYPEVAGPMAKMIGQLQEKITRQEKVLSAIGNERQQTALEEQATLLQDAHPDWETVTANDKFGAWLNAQPRHIKEAAIRNAEQIVDWQEAADVVDRFKKHIGVASPANATASNGDKPNHRLDGKRRHQLESAASTRGRGPSVTSGIPEDADEATIWNAFEEMERRQAGRV